MTLAPGVYGIRLEGVDPRTAAMGSTSIDAPLLEVVQATGLQEHGTPDEVIELIDGGHVGIFKAQNLAVFVLKRHVSDDELLHPWLVPVISELAMRHGRLVLHGGVIERDGTAVAVLGDREAGKSTLMGAAAVRPDEFSVLADDLVVLKDGNVYAGPRCIDLRPASAALFPTLSTRLSRSDSRYRVFLPPCAPLAKLRGFVVLVWGDALRLEPLAVPLRIAALLPHLAASRERGAFDAVLALATVPVWRLHRPRLPALLDAAVDLLSNSILELDLPEVSSVSAATRTG